MWTGRSATFAIRPPVDWLGGQASTVILGLVYGYIPYLIIVLYAGLDRIDGRLLEASRDLGLGRVRTFFRVTLPLSRQTILAGMFITALPMVGDYFTNQLLSATPNTTMIGNVIEGQLETASEQGARRRALAHALRGAADPDDLLRDLHGTRRAGRTRDGDDVEDDRRAERRDRQPALPSKRCAHFGFARVRGAIPGSSRASHGSTSRGRSSRSASPCSSLSTTASRRVRGRVSAGAGT